MSTPERYLYPRKDSPVLTFFEFALRIVKAESQRERQDLDNERTLRGRVVVDTQKEMRASPFHKPWQEDLLDCEYVIEEACYLLQILCHETQHQNVLFNLAVDKVRESPNIRDSNFELTKVLYFYASLIGDIVFLRMRRSEFASTSPWGEIHRPKPTAEDLLTHVIHALERIYIHIRNTRHLLIQPKDMLKAPYFENCRLSTNVFMNDIDEKPHHSACEKLSIWLIHKFVDEVKMTRDVFMSKNKTLPQTGLVEVSQLLHQKMADRVASLNVVLARLNLSQHKYERKACRELETQFEQEEQRKALPFVSYARLATDLICVPRQAMAELTRRFNQYFYDYSRVCMSELVCRRRPDWITVDDKTQYQLAQARVMQKFEQSCIDAHIVAIELENVVGQISQYSAEEEQVILLTRFAAGIRIFHSITNRIPNAMHETDELLVNTIRLLDIQAISPPGYMSQSILNAFILLVGLQHVAMIENEKDVAARQRVVNQMGEILAAMVEREASMIKAGSYSHLSECRGQYLVEYYLLYRLTCTEENLKPNLLGPDTLFYNRASSLLNANTYLFLLHYLLGLQLTIVVDADNQVSTQVYLSSETIKNLLQIGIEAINDMMENAKAGVLISIPILKSFMNYFYFIVDNSPKSEETEAALKKFYGYLIEETATIATRYNPSTIVPVVVKDFSDERAKSFISAPVKGKSQVRSTPPKKKKQEVVTAVATEPVALKPRVADKFSVIREHCQNNPAAVLDFYQGFLKSNTYDKAYAVMGLLECYKTWPKTATQKVISSLLKTYENEIRCNNRFKQSHSAIFSQFEEGYQRYSAWYQSRFLEPKKVEASPPPPKVEKNVVPKTDKKAESKPKTQYKARSTQSKPIERTQAEEVRAKTPFWESNSKTAPQPPASLSPQEKLEKMGLDPKMPCRKAKLPLKLSPQEVKLLKFIDDAGYLRLLQGGAVMDSLYKQKYKITKLKERDIDWLVRCSIDELEKFLAQNSSDLDIGLLERNKKHPGLVITFKIPLESGLYKRVEIATFDGDLMALAKDYALNTGGVFYAPLWRLILDPSDQLPNLLGDHPVLCFLDPTIVPDVYFRAHPNRMKDCVYKLTRYQHYGVPMILDELLATAIKANASWMKVSPDSKERVPIKLFDKLFLQHHARRAAQNMSDLGLLEIHFPLCGGPQAIAVICDYIDEKFAEHTFMDLHPAILQRWHAFVFANFLFPYFKKSTQCIPDNEDDYRRHLSRILKMIPSATYDFYEDLLLLWKLMFLASKSTPYQASLDWLEGNKKPVVYSKDSHFAPQSQTLRLMASPRRDPGLTQFMSGSTGPSSSSDSQSVSIKK